MKTISIVILVASMFIMSCGKNKSLQTSNPNSNSKNTPQDTTQKPVAETDTTPRMKIPPRETYINKKSPDISTWIKNHCKGEVTELDTTSSLDLLHMIGVNVFPAFRKETKGSCYQTVRDTNVYVTGISTYCEEYDPILFVFVFNKKTNTLKKFDTYYGNNCQGNDQMFGGSYDSFHDFGPYFAIRVYHSNYGMEEMSSIIINEDLKVLEWLDGVHTEQQELEKEGEFADFYFEYEYSFSNDTLLQHCHLRGSKYKHSLDVEMDIAYTCARDTIILISRANKKKHDDYLEEMNKW